MDPDILMTFSRLPAALPIFQGADEKIRAAFPDVRTKVSKTQVGYYNKHLFAALWPPLRTLKGRTGLYIVLTFGLGYQKKHPRIIETVEPYPNRWTHHVLIAQSEEMDALMMAWLGEAYDFAMFK